MERFVWFFVPSIEPNIKLRRQQRRQQPLCGAAKVTEAAASEAGTKQQKAPWQTCKRTTMGLLVLIHLVRQVLERQSSICREVPCNMSLGRREMLQRTFCCVTQGRTTPKVNYKISPRSVGTFQRALRHPAEDISTFCTVWAQRTCRGPYSFGK